MKSSFLNSPTLLTFQNENINNPERIANIFNNFFGSIGEKTRALSPLLISTNLLDHTVSQVRL